MSEHRIWNVVHVHLAWDEEKNAWTLDPVQAAWGGALESNHAECDIHSFTGQSNNMAWRECRDLCRDIDWKPIPTLTGLRDLIDARQLLDALDEAEATLDRIEALATTWGHTRFRTDWNGDAYDEGRDDQIDRCEQQLRAVLDGREPSETTR